jgi:hypothetical protein
VVYGWSHKKRNGHLDAKVVFKIRWNSWKALSARVLLYGGFRFGPDMSTSELLPLKMTSKK